MQDLQAKIMARNVFTEMSMFRITVQYIDIPELFSNWHQKLKQKTMY